MTFIDWIKKVKTKKKMSYFIKNKESFNMLFHSLEMSQGIAGISGLYLYHQCIICFKRDGDCICYEKAVMGEISPEALNLILKQKIA